MRAAKMLAIACVSIPKCAKTVNLYSLVRRGQCRLKGIWRSAQLVELKLARNAAVLALSY